MIRSFPEDQRQTLIDGLLSPPTALALNGGELWVGGQGYLALVDLKERRIKKLAYISTRAVDQIQLGGGYIWASFDKHLYRAAISDLQ